MNKITIVAVVCTGLGIFAFVWGFLIEPNRLVLNRQQLNPAGWQQAHDGLRVVVISDLHGGANFMDESKLRQVVATANAEKPDLIVLLGDFVSQKGSGPRAGRPLRMPVSTIAKSISGLSATYGVFAVIGNHDEWFSRQAVRDGLEAVGIRMLVDEIATIEVNDEDLHLLGLQDLMSIRSLSDYHNETKELAKGLGKGNLIILMHNPDVVPFLTGDNSVSDNTRLILAGHTHGGQVWIPGIGSPIVPSNFGQRYAFGRVDSFGTDVFITTGIGTSIMPVRFLVPPEIVVLTLRSG